MEKINNKVKMLKSTGSLVHERIGVTRCAATRRKVVQCTATGEPNNIKTHEHYVYMGVCVCKFLTNGQTKRCVFGFVVPHWSASMESSSSSSAIGQ